MLNVRNLCAMSIVKEVNHSIQASNLWSEREEGKEGGTGEEEEGEGRERVREKERRSGRRKR